jgi:hypothetical protein
LDQGILKLKNKPMTNNPQIAKWTGSRDFIPAAGKHITATGPVIHLEEIAQQLVYLFLRGLVSGRAYISGIILLLSGNQRMKGGNHPLYAGSKLTCFPAIVLTHPGLIHIPRNKGFKKEFLLDRSFITN